MISRIQRKLWQNRDAFCSEASEATSGLRVETVSRSDWSAWCCPAKAGKNSGRLAPAPTSNSHVAVANASWPLQDALHRLCEHQHACLSTPTTSRSQIDTLDTHLGLTAAATSCSAPFATCMTTASSSKPALTFEPRGNHPDHCPRLLHRRTGALPP